MAAMSNAALLRKAAAVQRLLDYTGTFWDNFTASFANYTNRNSTNIAEFDSNLVKAEDVSVDAVVTSFYFNTVVFILLMCFYECLRRVLPAVYSSRKRLHFAGRPHHHHQQQHCHDDNNNNNKDDPLRRRQQPSHQSNSENYNNNNTTKSNPLLSSRQQSQQSQNDSDDLLYQNSSESTLPDERPLDWIGPVFGVPWSKVRQTAGLDGYFFLRYIRMNVRITAVSTFWFFLILVPVYATGDVVQESLGWYHLSAANLPSNSRRMWVPCIFLYLFTAFIFFVVKQEYRHFLEVRQDFLAKGTIHVHPQHHYSVMVENIPPALRSDQALADYFNKLFPGTVHSAVVVLKLPELEEASMRCLRSCRRLEKSLAYLHATQVRPTHIVGRGRVSVLGIDLAPLECSQPCGSADEEDVEDFYCPLPDDPITNNTTSTTSNNNNSNNDSQPHQLEGQPEVVVAQYQFSQERPARGTRVDSISYYTRELAAHSRALLRMQQRKAGIAASGQEDERNHSSSLLAAATNDSSNDHDVWFMDRVVREVTLVADQIMDDSVRENALVLALPSDDDDDVNNNNDYLHWNHHDEDDTNNGKLSPPIDGGGGGGGVASIYGSIVTPSSLDDFPAATAVSSLHKRAKLVENNSMYDEELMSQDSSTYAVPFARDQYRNVVVRLFGRFGLDFLVYIFRAFTKQIDVALEGVTGATMSSTGFVTFLDLASTTCAASAPLSVKATVLNVGLAPEPREIIWENAHVSNKIQVRREFFANIVLLLGAILWSFPLAAIQLFAKAENLAQIPGLEWILYAHGGTFRKFVNGYLPVVALLGLISVLPVIFENVAIRYERRKTISDVQASMLGRYFYYQLANIYVSVTAGSLLKSLADILDHPSNILQLLGKSLPSMVGYFVALLVTKILAGLPMIFLRFGALARMLFLRILSDEKKLTQRELDSVYRLENVQYGWEFPTQLLVVVIVFTYAVISPLILPFGLLYFMGALTVYKKQILYVYSPVYESGGAMFPIAVQRSLFGLICAQMTFWGYLVTRGCYYQPVFLFPLPIFTAIGMNYLQRTYASPSERLSLERAREFDRLSSMQQKQQATDSSTTNLYPKGENESSRNLLDHGLDARRNNFDRSKYRQPVLTVVPTEPWTYRRGLADDPETMAVRHQLRLINRYVVAQTEAEQRRLGTLKSPT